MFFGIGVMRTLTLTFTLNYTHTHLAEDGGVLFVYTAIFVISSSLLLVTQDAVQLTQHLYVCVCVCGVCVCMVCKCV